MMTERDDIELLLHALADGELDAAAALDVERRIAADPDLARRYESAVAVKNAVESLPRPTVSDAFRSRIASLPGGRAEPASPRVRVERHTDRRALAASIIASVLVASSATYLITAPPSQNAAAALMAADHRRSLLAASPVDVASSDRHTVKPWLASRIGVSPPAPDLAAQGFALLGGRVEVVGERAVPALVYRHREHLITLIAIPDPEGETRAPESLAAGGFGLVHWSGNGFAYWAISDTEPAQLGAFAAAFRAATAQE
jgi:anti-sigma factor RsiW